MSKSFPEVRRYAAGRPHRPPLRPGPTIRWAGWMTVAMAVGAALALVAIYGSQR